MNKERKEEETKILAQMEEAMRENEGETTESAPKRSGLIQDKTPSSIHCRKCGTLMQDGKCPQCGHTVYTPMDEKTQKTVRWILGGVCLAVLLIVLLLK